MKGFMGASLVIISLLFVTGILASFIATTQVKIHLIGEMETQIKDNKAYYAILAILSKTYDGKPQVYRLVEDIKNGNSLDWVGNQLEKMGIDCYILKKTKDGNSEVLLKKECGASYQFVEITVPLPNLESVSLSLGVGK